jgi:hypothetical protein
MRDSRRSLLGRRLSCHRRKAVTAGETAQPFDGLVKCERTISDGGHGAHFLRDHLVDVVAVMEPHAGSGSTDSTQERCASEASEPRNEAAALPRPSAYAVPSFGEWSEVRNRRVVTDGGSVTPHIEDKNDTRGALKSRESVLRCFLVRLTVLRRAVDA